MEAAPIAITVLEAAELLHCSRAMVFQLLARGEIDRAQNAGKETLILRSSCVDYLLAPIKTPAAARRRARRKGTPPPPVSVADLRFK